MNANKPKLLLTAIASAVAISSAAVLAADEPVPVYGRAGIPVGSARIEQLSRVTGSAANAKVVTWYGRAGGPVGLDRSRAANAPSKSYAAGNAKQPIVYGRAGVPLPFGG